MEHDEPTLRQMLEYIYTNRVKDMPGLSADEVIKLLALANGKGFAVGLLPPAREPRSTLTILPGTETHRLACRLDGMATRTNPPTHSCGVRRYVTWSLAVRSTRVAFLMSTYLRQAC